jgi:hypothetical protein
MLRVAEVWKECDVDDNADANLAAAALELLEQRFSALRRRD